VFLVLAGLYAARTIVGWRRWAWPNPWKSTQRATMAPEEAKPERAAELLRDFSFNWEVAYVKLRALDNAYRCFTVALLLFMLLALAFVVYESAAAPDDKPTTAPAVPAVRVTVDVNPSLSAALQAFDRQWRRHHKQHLALWRKHHRAPPARKR
jgi:hypothetical protein